MSGVIQYDNGQNVRYYGEMTNRKNHANYQEVKKATVRGEGAGSREMSGGGTFINPK